MRPIYNSYSKESCWHAILCHMKQQARFLASLINDNLIAYFIRICPFHSLPTPTCFNAVYGILTAEYGEDILLELSHPFLTPKERFKEI